MRSSRRTKVLGAVAGVLAGVVGLGVLVVHGPQLVGTILLVAGLGFGGTMLASLWIYRSGD